MVPLHLIAVITSLSLLIPIAVVANSLLLDHTRTKVSLMLTPAIYRFNFGIKEAFSDSIWHLYKMEQS